MPFGIRKKLLVAFFIMLLPLFALIAISHFNQRAIYRGIERVEESSREMAYLAELQLSLNELVMPANDYLIHGDIKEKGEFGRLVARTEHLINDISKTAACSQCHVEPYGILERVYGLEPKHAWPEEMRHIKIIVDGFEVIKEKGEEIFKLEKPIGSVEGGRMMEEMDAISHELVRTHIARFVESDRERFDNAVFRAERAWERSWVIMIGGSLVLVALGISFSTLYSRYFARPIMILHERADAIAKGDFKTRLDIKTGDELQQLANAMNEMAEQLDSFYGNLERQVEERTRELQYERDKLIRVFEAMEDGVYIVDQQYDIQYLNPVLLKEFGPIEGKKCYVYFHDRTEVCPWCPNQRVFAGETVRWEWYSFKSGKTYDLLDTPLRQPDGSIWKLEIFRDITERKKAEERIKEQLDYLERFQKVAVKREFRIKELVDEVERLKGKIGEIEKG